MGVRKLYVLPGGYITLDKGILTYETDMGEKVLIPVCTYLIVTDEGNILVDTGLNPDGVEKPEVAWGERAKFVVPKITKEDSILNRLLEIGFKPEDIDIVVNSHLHFDHTGGNRFFTNASFIVQKDEFRYALFPDNYRKGSYIRNHFDHPLKYDLIEGDKEIVSGVSVLETAGHTPGHQSIIVSLKRSGTVVLPIDAIYMKENIERDIPAGNTWNSVLAMKSMHRLMHVVRREMGSFIFGHDPGFWGSIKKAPDFYD